MGRSKVLRMLFIAASLVSAISCAQDGYDTLYTRSNSYILKPRYDTVTQLKIANAKADSILNELVCIKRKLGIKDTVQ